MVRHGKGLEQSQVEVKLGILLGRLFLLVFGVEHLSLVVFVVSLDGFHGVLSILVPWRLLLEDHGQLLLESGVLLPVLDEVSLHELVVEQQDGEVQLAILVQGDLQFQTVWQVVHLFAQFHFVFPKLSVDLDLFIFLLGLQTGHFFNDNLLVFEHVLESLFDLFESLVPWAFIQTFLCVVETFGPLLKEVSGSAQRQPHHAVGVFDLESFKAVFFALAELGHQEVELCSSHIEVEFALVLCVPGGERFIEEVKGSFALDFVVLLVLGLGFDDLFKGLKSIVLEVPALLLWSSIVFESLQSCKLWFFEHLGGNVSAKQGMFLEVFSVIFFFTLWQR